MAHLPVTCLEPNRLLFPLEKQVWWHYLNLIIQRKPLKKGNQTRARKFADQKEQYQLGQRVLDYLLYRHWKLYDYLVWRITTGGSWPEYGNKLPEGLTLEELARLAQCDVSSRCDGKGSRHIGCQKHVGGCLYHSCALEHPCPIPGCLLSACAPHCCVPGCPHPYSPHENCRQVESHLVVDGQCQDCDYSQGCVFTAPTCKSCQAYGQAYTQDCTFPWCGHCNGHFDPEEKEGVSCSDPWCDPCKVHFDPEKKGPCTRAWCRTCREHKQADGSCRKCHTCGEEHDESSESSECYCSACGVCHNKDRFSWPAKRIYCPLCDCCHSSEGKWEFCVECNKCHDTNEVVCLYCPLCEFYHTRPVGDDADCNIECSRCGFASRKKDWSDGGRTCPTCSVVHCDHCEEQGAVFPYHRIDFGACKRCLKCETFHNGVPGSCEHSDSESEEEDSESEEEY